MKDQSVQKNATVKPKPPKRKDKHNHGGKHKKKFKKDFQPKKKPDEGQSETTPKVYEPFPAPHSFGKWEKVETK